MDATFVAFVAFVLFFAILFYLKVPGKVGKLLDDRADQIKSELEEARRLREEAQALLADYQRKARSAEKEAEEIIAQAKTDADAMAREARAALDDMVKRRGKQAEQKIAQAEAAAISDVRLAATDAAIAAAESILADAAAKPKTAKSLFDNSLKEIKANLS